MKSRHNHALHCSARNRRGAPKVPAIQKEVLVQGRGLERSIRSPIRWAGSKAKLIPSLHHYWKASGSTRYLEAFCGSAAFFFSAAPTHALLNDTNEELIGALALLRRFPRLVHYELTSMEPAENRFYRLRGLDPSSLDDIDRAIRFFYLNRYCFNGIYRTNKLGQFNVPFGRTKTGRFPSLNDWVTASELLQNTKLSTSDFEEFVLREARANDFVYLDPPYAVSNRRVFAQYSANSFGTSDIQRLRALLSEIDRRGAKFLVSYAQSPEAAILSDGWKTSRVYAQRNVAGFATHRRRALEIFISNFDL